MSFESLVLSVELWNRFAMSCSTNLSASPCPVRDRVSVGMTYKTHVILNPDLSPMYPRGVGTRGTRGVRNLLRAKD